MRLREKWSLIQVTGTNLGAPCRFYKDCREDFTLPIALKLEVILRQPEWRFIDAPS